MKKLIGLIMVFSLLGINTGFAAGINNSNNKTGCTYARHNIKNAVYQDFVNGLATERDLIKELEWNIKVFDKTSSYTTGSIKTNMKNMSNAYKAMRMSVYQDNFDKFTASAVLQIKYINTLDKLCKSIGK